LEFCLPFSLLDKKQHGSMGGPWSKDKSDAARAHDSQASDKYFVAVECANDLPPPQKSRTERPAQTKKGFRRKLNKKLWLG
jgi:hypothetical protein